MLAVSVELLSGRYVATAYNDREQAEWPPHPARFFSALVSTWAEGDPEGEQGALELAALHWLEQQDAPVILASATRSAGLRGVVPVFVPVNDVSIVSIPEREKLDLALAEAAGAHDDKGRAKALKQVEKATQKLGDDTARAIAVPLKQGKGDIQAVRRLMPEGRAKQPRTFPGTTPECSTIAFIFPEAEIPVDLGTGLRRLLSRTVRVGHSSTFVAIRFMDQSSVSALEARTTRFEPDDETGDLMLRWVLPEQVERLQQAFELHRETEPRILPARFVRYREGAASSTRAPTAANTIFESDFVVLARVGGPRLPVVSAAGLARQVRRVLMKFSPEPVSEMLSGHREPGEASERPHLAVVPLPSAGHAHSDGALLGVALMLPRRISEDERLSVLRALGQLERHHADVNDADTPTIPILLGESGVLELQRIAWRDPSATLRASSWSRASRRWASVTPVALDRNPGDLHDADPARRAAAFEEATRLVRIAVARIFDGTMPEIVELDVLRSAVVPGSAKPRAFPRFPVDPNRPQRVLVHVRILFRDPVVGPILVGAGRFQGLGLLLPLLTRDGSRSE